MNVITKTVQLPDGRTISIETGKVAKQADGAAVLRMGNTVLLATVCAAKEAVPGTDFMPLQVDYREQYAAAGHFPGGFTKREGKANDDEILTSRLVDRVLRPLFPSDFHTEVFVNVILFSADGVDQPDALAGFAGFHDDSSMGMLEILPPFRRRGYAAQLEAFLIAAALKEGRTPYCHVVDGNEASLHLQRKMGLTCTRLPAIWVN